MCDIKYPPLPHLDKSDDEWTGQLIVTHEDFLQSLVGLTPSVPPEEQERYQHIKTTLRN